MSELATTLVLEGSGEFTPAMEDTDRYLLSKIANRHPTIAILPTAAGLEHDWHKWIDDGVRHFRYLGVSPLSIIGLKVRSRQDAADPQWTKLVESADLLYLSGGSPEHLYASLNGTPLWQTIVDRYHRDMILAGASAGAMVLGAYMPRTIGPKVLSGVEGPTWTPASGLTPYSVLPHYDHMPRFLKGWRERLLKSTPPEIKKTLIGIDEDTALIIENDTEKILGRGTVTRIR